jgi:hypothetical protein
MRGHTILTKLIGKRAQAAGLLTEVLHQGLGGRGMILDAWRSAGRIGRLTDEAGDDVHEAHGSNPSLVCLLMQPSCRCVYGSDCQDDAVHTLTNIRLVDYDGVWSLAVHTQTAVGLHGTGRHSRVVLQAIGRQHPQYRTLGCLQGNARSRERVNGDRRSDAADGRVDF